MESPLGDDTQGMDMQICYIWVEGFKGLKNFGLNLSSEYDFNYRGDTVTAIKKSNITKKLYGKKISDVSAIIGINGSGKTTCLELTCRILKDPESIESSYLLILKNNSSFYIHTNITTNLKYPSLIKKPKYKIELEKTRVVYHSNIYDDNPIFFSEKVDDISINSRRFNELLKDKSKQYSDIENQMNFLISDDSKALKIESPIAIEYRLINHKEIDLLDLEFKKQIANRNDPFIKNLGFILEKINELFLHAEKQDLNEKTINTTLFLKRKIIKDLFSLKNSTLGFLDRLVDILLHKVHACANIDSALALIAFHSNNIPKYKNYFSEEFTLYDVIYKILLSPNNFLRLASEDVKKSDNELNISLKINFSSETISEHKILSSVFNQLDYAHARWFGQSSGQKAYLDLYSLIWSKLKEKTLAPYDATILCIDEPDLYLHPQWQVNFLSNLVQSLPTLTGGKIQLIFTTHSPLLLSDIPKQNLCEIDTKTINSEHRPSSAVPNTFGANLYDLYSKVFGISYHSMGNIAKKYINKTLRILEKDKTSKADYNHLKQAQDNIGDEIILFHIEKRINNIETEGDKKNA